ncbi:MAG TPA: acyl-CoA dehydratase activase-related protein [Tissierellaceae bacterium]|nr:acyl-CoA dehydratase activase-related protein [Tissierellaceae bacterium]
MVEKIGVPRGMLYYEFYPIWERYFKELDYELVSSPNTNKDILNMGIHSSVDEACLPVKIFHGHVEYLKDKVDYLFIPKIISIYKKEYCCPKILGLPDMIKHSINELPEIIDVQLNLFKRNNFKRHFSDIGERLNIERRENVRAYKNAIKDPDIQNKWIREKIIGNEDNRIGSNEINILLLGHSYNVYDNFINMNIINKLRDMNINIIVSDDINNSDIREYSNKIPKRMFWTHGRKTTGSAFKLMDEGKIDGIIYLSSFGCGLDSILSYIVSHKATEHNIPIMELTLDEQTGEAGFDTRIEAFLDMMKWRDRSEDNIPSFR